MNTVTISGSITREVELLTTPGGRHVAAFGLAHWQDGGTEYFNVVAWYELAETAAATFTKGDRITVIGRLKQRCWTTSDGEPRSVVEIQAAEFAISAIDVLAHLATDRGTS